MRKGLKIKKISTFVRVYVNLVFFLLSRLLGKVNGCGYVQFCCQYIIAFAGNPSRTTSKGQFAQDKSELVVSLLQLPLIIIEMFLVVHQLACASFSRAHFTQQGFLFACIVVVVSSMICMAFLCYVGNVCETTSSMSFYNIVCKLGCTFQKTANIEFLIPTLVHTSILLPQVHQSTLQNIHGLIRKREIDYSMFILKLARTNLLAYCQLQERFVVQITCMIQRMNHIQK